MRRVAALVALLLAGVLPAGCGLGAGDSQDEPVNLTVTRDFGHERLGGGNVDGVPEGETVMRLLQRDFEVTTRYGGGFVQSIGGIAGGREAGRPVDWFYYVNGSESPTGAAERKVSGGDRVWWDHHDWGEAMRIPAVVGAFPQPFASGEAGKRMPVRIECAKGSSRECDEVGKRLEDAGVDRTATSTIGQAQENEVLRVLVGPWDLVRLDPASVRLERGPQQSGVFARFDRGGDRLELLDTHGTTVSTLGPGSGLVAATALEGGAPVWLVTGTDRVGVAAAAAALQEATLRNRFAVAVEAGRPQSIPIVESR